MSCPSGTYVAELRRLSASAIPETSGCPTQRRHPFRLDRAADLEARHQLLQALRRARQIVNLRVDLVDFAAHFLGARTDLERARILIVREPSNLRDSRRNGARLG